MNIESGQTQKRIAIFVWGDVRLGGAERRFFRLFNHLRENGCAVKLYTSDSGAAACAALGIRLDSEHVHVFSEPGVPSSRRWLYIALFWRLVNLVTQVRRDKISHLHFGENPGALSFLYSLATRFACPFSVSLVDSIRSYQRTFRSRLYVRVTARYSSYVDCLSSEIRADLASFLRNRHEYKCLVSPCSFTDPKAALSINAHVADTRDIDIALVARLTPGKGHGLLKAALMELGRLKRTGLVVHICGSGPMEAQIRQEFLSVSDQQIHLYFQPEPFRILRRAKVYVALQDVENYPSQSLLEAMTCECAIVATDVGLTRQLLNDSCAVLIPSTPVALAEALQRLLDQASLRVELGRNAKRIVTSTQTIERFAAYFLTDVLKDASCTT